VQGLQRRQRGQPGGFRAQDTRPQPQAVETGRRQRTDIAFAQSTLRPHHQQAAGRGESQLAGRAAGLRQQGQAQRAVIGKGVQPRRQRQCRNDLGQARATALFAGAGHHRAPVRQPLFRAGGIQLHLRAFGQQRHDARHAQLGRLLHDQVHLLAARHALGQGQRQRRLVLQSLLRLDPHGHLTLAHREDDRGVVVAVAVEHGERIAGAHAQHARHVFGGLWRQVRFAGNGKWLVDVDTDRAHRNGLGGNGRPA
jgi:hypothetical protein